MHVSEWLPVNKWVGLSHAGEEIAEAFLEPDGESFTLAFRVPRNRFDGADGGRPVTIEDLLSAASVSTDEVASWEIGDPATSGSVENLPETIADSPAAAMITVTVRLKPPVPAEVGSGIVDHNVPPQKWQILEASWKTILGLEASIDTLRLSMDGLRAEMESAFKKTMGVEEKMNALQGDVAQWNKAKSRVHYSIPKVREFVHRATWATGVPERKRLGELFENHIEPRIPFPEMDQERERMEHLQKDRQILFAQGNAVNLECRGLLAEIQRAFSTLQRNAADRRRAKRSAGREKGKFF